MEVPETLTHPITVFRPVRDHGQFIVDATIASVTDVDEMRSLKRRRRRGAR